MVVILVLDLEVEFSMDVILVGFSEFLSFVLFGIGRDFIVYEVKVN